MSREAHVQFCESLGVRLPGATHPDVRNASAATELNLGILRVTIGTAQSGFCTERCFSSHPFRLFSISYVLTGVFHGGNPN